MKFQLFGKEFNLNVYQRLDHVIALEFNKHKYMLVQGDKLYVVLHIDVELENFKSFNNKTIDELISRYNLIGVRYERNFCVSLFFQLHRFDYQSLAKQLKSCVVDLETKSMKLLESLMKAFELDILNVNMFCDPNHHSLDNNINLEVYAYHFHLTTNKIIRSQNMLRLFWNLVDKPYVRLFSIGDAFEKAPYVFQVAFNKNIMVFFNHITPLPIENVVIDYIHLEKALGDPVKKHLEVCLINDQLHLCDSDTRIVYHTLKLSSLNELRYIPLLAYINDSDLKRFVTLSDLACLLV